VTIIEAGLDILTLKEVATYLRVTELRLYRLIRDGQLFAFKLGCAWHFRREEFNQCIAESIGKQRGEDS